ncbi:MAG: DNA-3-methyladenine glycosylase family protein [Acidimicrobiales bacterium]
MDRWAEGCAAIAGADPALATVVARHGPCTLAPRRGMVAFAALARAICYQQLAGAAAAAIHGRFAALYGGRPTPDAVAATPEEDLRAAGLSAAKTAAIRDLATKMLDGTVPQSGWGRLSDEAIVQRLVAVRGVGPWTAQMFLIFQLARPDVWPTGDLGVRVGYGRIHGLAAPPTPAELGRIGEAYRPFRTLAAWYCWRAVDEVSL